MTDYSELVKALRCCGSTSADCTVCPWDKYTFGMCAEKLLMDAAAAIEELIESVHIRDKILDELNHYIWKLEAEVKRLKECNDELREAQTYIDHYGDRWMTSAKDVPTAAYEHGYADGRGEAEAQLPKRGEWIWDDKRCIYVCSVCGSPKVRENMDRQIIKEQAYCYSCGAKMEVQDGTE